MTALITPEAPPEIWRSSSIVVEGLGKTFTSEEGEVFTALKEVSFEIRAGEFLSLLGPSGCGKSTILRIISGLERPTEGRITIGGEPMEGAPPNLGIVFQRDVLLDWRTIVDNVLLPVEFARGNKAEARKVAMSLLSLYGLKGFENRYPWELSGGMRQRASICRALLLDPAFLMMDEPFGALDALTRDELNLELQSLWERTKKTVLFVTHGIAEAVFLSDRVAVMATSPGRIVEIIDVDLPRPRDFSVRATPKFGGYVDQIRMVFERHGLFGHK
jgi:NitT/TauT family transport system ATP-binding protein